MKHLLSTLIAASTLVVSSTTFALTLSGDSSYVASDNSEAFINLNDTSSLEVVSGGDVAHIYAYDDSSVSVLEGSEISFLNTFGNSSSTISGGDISWLKFYEDSSADITFVEDLSWLIVDDNTQVDLYGYDFQYDNNHLSGFWANGMAFEFWAVEEDDLFSGSLPNVLPDNITLHTVSVPEPGSWALLALGLAGLSLRKKAQK